MNIVITGASKGMGKALAVKFAKQENNIFICARNENELANTAKEIKEKNNAVVEYFAADLSEKLLQVNSQTGYQLKRLHLIY